MRPLTLHCTRHSWATHALAAGKSNRWVADRLGHGDPSLTMRVYAHAQPEEEDDVSFADYGAPARPYTAPPSSTPHRNISQVRERPGAAGTTRMSDTRVNLRSSSLIRSFSFLRGPLSPLLLLPS